MRSTSRFGLLTAGFLLLILSDPSFGGESIEDAFEKDTLIVEASRYGCFRFDVYVARTDEQRRRGLMFVEELPETTGMLFVRADEARLSVWMKNTLIPLDIIFARADGEIVNVVRNAEPGSEEHLWSAGVVSFVLEVNAGITERYAIDDASRIQWERAPE